MRHLIPLVLLLLVCSGCREEGLTTTTTTTGTIPPPDVVFATITTVVIGQDGAPISDATITGLSSAGRPNPDGILTIDAGSLSTEGSLVTVSSPGHWPERRLLMPAGEGQLVETFVLEPKVKAGEINPVTGGALVIAENFSLRLAANTIVTKVDGSAYTSQVAVYLNHDAPEDRNEMINSPGNVLARLANGELASMESYGIMDIALETPAGEPLELDQATPAEVRANGYGEENGVFISIQPDGNSYVSVDNCAAEGIVVQAFTSDYRASSPLVQRTPGNNAPETLVVCGDLAPGEGRVYVDPEGSVVLTGTSVSARGNLFAGTFSASMNLQNDAEQVVEAVNLPVTGTFRIQL